MFRKRIVDVLAALVASLAWAPIVTISFFVALAVNGWPVFYVSKRRVHRSKSIGVFKFRTMERNAASVANRETIPVTKQRFLNIPFDSPIYTPLGRLFERCCITELPQFVHVLLGQMSLIGNRPLPENVIESLREEYPNVEDRFLSKAGMTGPVQLVGRDNISDEQRLAIEITYCKLCHESYSVLLDLVIFVRTVGVVLHVFKPQTLDQVKKMMLKICNRTEADLFGRQARQRSGVGRSYEPGRSDQWSYVSDRRTATAKAASTQRQK